MSAPVSWLAFVTYALFSTVGFAQPVTANLAAGEQIFNNGKGDVPACTSCHGENGMGMDAMQTPRLANLGYAYVVKQLTDFANDKRIDLTMGIMNDNAKGLSEQDRRDVAAYVNTLKNPTDPSDLKALKEEGTPVGEPYLGQIIVQYGIKDKVSACMSCHGYNGRGADPIYPMIGQQKYVYLVNQLTRWRDESRANDLMGQMRVIAKNLTDEDIQNVAAFLSQAPDTTPGNSFAVNNQTTLNHVLKKGKQ